MSKFKYLVTEILPGGRVWKHEIVVTANEKLDAAAKIEQMYPSPRFKCKFLETC